MAAGRVPSGFPLSQFVLKVHSRCDLACDHCYVYEHADQSWRARPTVMTAETVRFAARRIAEHAAAHRLPRVHVILHGGEPLLAGRDRLGEVMGELRRTIEPVTELDLRMQTNGVLLDEAMAEQLARHDVRVGISLDGDRASNDRHRRFAHGGGSYDHVVRALALLRRPAYRRLYAGILCTIDVRNDPVAVYDALAAQAPPRLDFLLPHATWRTPPPRPAGQPTPYAAWLLRVHERWTADGRPMPVRTFDAIASTAAGGPSGAECVGLDPADLVVIETDGTFEQADSLKTTFDGAAATGFDVYAHTVDEVAASPGVRRRQTGLADLCATCRACPVVRQCGGGLFAHRYRDGSGFDNPSVYCADLKELILTMNERSPRPAPARAAHEPAAALPQELLDEVAARCAGETTVATLAEAQLSISRALVVAVAHAADGWGPAKVAWDLLVELDRVAPQAVASVLAHPYVRAWAVDCLRQGDDVAVDDRAYLANVAVAAALRAGPVLADGAELVVGVHGRAVHLPTLGSAVLPVAGQRTAELTVKAGTVVVRAGLATMIVRPGDGPSLAWQPAHRITAQGRTLLLEDQDPYRDRHSWKADRRQSTVAVAEWARSVDAALSIVRTDAAGYLPGLLAGLRAITPLVSDPAGLMRSAAARQAFGVIGTAAAADDALAVMLVHEFQHVVLGAVLDLCELVDPAYTPRLRVGWRPDPRPVEAVLQGTYAHLAVADVWRARAERDGGAASAAIEHYRQYHDWTAAAIDGLSASGALTTAGRRFVGRMGQTLAGWSR